MQRVGPRSCVLCLSGITDIARVRNSRCPGTRRAGDALGHRQDRLPSVAHRRIPAALSREPETDLLLSCVALRLAIDLLCANLILLGTMSEIEKALTELKALMKYRAEQLGYVEDFRGLGLTSRKNLCLHPSVKREKSGNVVDARCRSLTAGFVKEKKERGEDVDVCIYHDVR